VQQQDSEQHYQQTERKASCVHESDPSWRVLHQTAWAEHSLAEKPKVGELQMDCLRSEDLKEEKNVTAPIAIIAL
jgi:hypothetical protein